MNLLMAHVMAQFMAHIWRKTAPRRAGCAIRGAKAPPFMAHHPQPRAVYGARYGAVYGAVVLVLAAAHAHAFPPPGANMDTPEAKWFESLHARGPSGGEGMPCCSIADCRPTAVRTAPGGFYEAFISKERFGNGAPDDWVRVPEETKLTRTDNPMGDPVVCYYMGRILCFVDSSKV